LQTAEAYQEYFKHLTDNGILHINHYAYPRMVTTAALAWKEMGRNNFQKHVLVIKKGDSDIQPTFLVKMKPWTESELNELKTLFFKFPIRKKQHYKIVEDPLHPEDSFLSPAFYSGDFPPDLARRMDYRIIPATDDRPYFGFLRKKIGRAKPNYKNFMDESMAGILNSQTKGLISLDTIQFIVTAIVSLFFAGVFIVLPLYFSSVGKTKWSQKLNSMFYFSCLGSGFIIFELVFIQIFMKLIGSPLYTYATVIFTLLFAAGIGSFSSKKLNITLSYRWAWPFIGILINSTILLIFYPFVFKVFLASPTLVRIIASGLLIFPIGFFLGMPFPIGILAIQNQPAGAIAWAWGLNSLFTVVGSLISVLLSIFLGFRVTLIVAITFYVFAFWFFWRIHLASQSSDFNFPNKISFKNSF